MIRKEIFCSLLVLLVLLSACQSGRRCKGGGWYGNRNLTQIEQPQQDQAIQAPDSIRALVVEP